MAFPPQFLDEIRARLSVSSVVGKRVKLIRRGREYVGLSPFSNEKTPSFTVNDEKGFYHCFSSSEHGDIFKFLMKTQNLSFPEAVERLADEAGLEMPRETPEAAQEAARATILREAVDAACVIFEQALRSSEGRSALEYLKGRGLTDETIARFRLGYAPTGNTVKSKLTARGIKEDVLIETRLLSQGKDGRESFDFFRGRVVFPIMDVRGRPVAFGGRIMGEGEPKYLNSADTPLFHKGHMLYGLDLARGPAAKAREIIVAEGYMDVIALAQAGLPNAVAPLGTAMTEAQIELLWRTAPEPVLCFDGDAAGQKAAMRVAERALPMLKPGFSVRFAMMPLGEDPDDICRRGGAAAMVEFLANALPLSEVVWRRLVAEHPGETPERRAGLERAAMEKAGLVADSGVQNQYRRMFRERLFEQFRAVSAPKTQEFGRKRSGSRWPSARKNASFAPVPTRFTLQDASAAQRKREHILLVTLLNHPALADHVEERLGGMGLSDSRLDSLRQTALMHIAQYPDLEFGDLHAHLAGHGFAEELEKLLNSDIYVHAGFARPTTALDQATVGWDHTFAMCQRTALEAELKRAEMELAENPSEQAFATFKALQDQAGPAGDEDDDQIGIGQANHHNR
jgi:DNA primase